jgi:hypothetical protein
VHGFVRVFVAAWGNADEVPAGTAAGCRPDALIRDEERQLLELLAQGRTDEAAARQLGSPSAIPAAGSPGSWTCSTPAAVSRPAPKRRAEAGSDRRRRLSSGAARARPGDRNGIMVTSVGQLLTTDGLHPPASSIHSRDTDETARDGPGGGHLACGKSLCGAGRTSAWSLSP